MSQSSNSLASEEEFSIGPLEQVWSPNVEAAFFEALKKFPACGKKKLLGDDGRKYGKKNFFIKTYFTTTLAAEIEKFRS